MSFGFLAALSQHGRNAIIAFAKSKFRVKDWEISNNLINLRNYYLFSSKTVT